MPLGPYADWDECIRKNQDKADPERYCGALEREAAKGSAMSTHVVLLAPEGVKTSDRRFFAPGSLEWRDDIPLMFESSNVGHEGAEFAGNATNLRRQTVDGQTWIVGDVEWDTDTELGREAQRLGDQGKIAGVSVDLAMDYNADIEVLETDEFGDATDWLITFNRAEIIGFTQLPMPAFAGAKILRADQIQALAAAANPQARADWFRNPDLAGPTPLTVTDEGRVYGHLATWGTCHVGFQGTCVTPPTSETDYAYFNLGAVKVGGEEIACGHITLGTGHAQLNADAQAAAEHYDHTGSVAADVAAGEDEHGIWVAGAARPGVDLDVLRSASLSGDWRKVNGNLELVAALAVNVPGFPVPRIAASIAGGDQLALVASGVVEQRDREDLIVAALRHLSAKIDQLTEFTDARGVVENNDGRPAEELIREDREEPPFSALARRFGA